jgi:hypothetical protein
MNKPSWVNTIGTLAIIFGVLGLLTAAQTAMMPNMIEMQRKMMESVTLTIPGQQRDQHAIDELKKTIEGLWGNPPGWFRSACFAMGIAGALINALYIFAAASLLQMKRFSLMLFYTAMAVSIAFSVIRGVTFVNALPLIGMSMLFAALVGVAMDVVLLLVVATADKKGFSSSGVTAAV